MSSHSTLNRTKTNAEQRESMKRLRWSGIGIDEEFYSYRDVDNWHYLVYTPSVHQAGKSSRLNGRRGQDAFNSNMMATSLQSEVPLEFTRQHQRAWLVAEYGAGDIVLQKPHGVGETRFL